MAKVKFLRVYGTETYDDEYDYSRSNIILESLSDWVEVQNKYLSDVRQKIEDQYRENLGYDERIVMIEDVTPTKKDIKIMIDDVVKAQQAIEEAKEKRKQKAARMKEKKALKDIEEKKKLLENLKKELGE